MAPGAVSKSARAADPHSDVYSLGVIFYEMLSGDIPFDADTDAGAFVRYYVLDAPPLFSKAPSAGMALAALVHRMLGKTPRAVRRLARSRRNCSSFRRRRRSARRR